MALLSSCWFIIEFIIVQDGFLKWYYMNLYINPFILFLCQVLIWFNMLHQWLLQPLTLFSTTALSMFMLFFKFLIHFLWFLVRKVKRIMFRQEINNLNLEVSRRIYNPTHHFIDSCSFLSDQQTNKIQEREEEIFFDFDDDGGKMSMEETYHELCLGGIDTQIEDLEFESQSQPMYQRNSRNIEEDDEDSSADDEDDDEDNINLNESSFSSVVLVSQTKNSPKDDVDLNNDPSSSSISSSPEDSTVIKNSIPRERDENETDEFYEKYWERMRWYDVLNHDRIHGLSTILERETEGSQLSWGKSETKRLKESIERDLELVYVAQSCLTWEALHHQYTKVRDDISKSAEPNGGFYDDLSAEDFQKFQVLLERFLEDERCGEKRVMGFVKRRFEFMSFFQVPKLLGYKEGTNEEANERKEVGTKEVMKAIEKCIEAFYEFVKIDNKRHLWSKLRSFLSSDPLVEVEDPRDINLFVALSTSLHKKEQQLKEIQGKIRKYRLKGKKSKPELMEEKEKEEMLQMVEFAEIDMKLVSRVLQMPLLSSSHLKWCQDKIESLHFKDGMIHRTSSSSSSSCFLFPSS